MADTRVNGGIGIRLVVGCVWAAACWGGGVACTPTGSFKVTAVPADQTLEEQVVARDPGWISERIALLDVSGVLINAAEPGLLSEGEHVVSFIVEKLNKAAADRRVRAVVLRINSPGGTVTASDTIYEELRRFRAVTGKPVVAFFQDVAASGAYYLACAADEIVAQPTSVTGSIGVVMQMVDLSGTMAKLGISTEAITSGPFKDAGSPFRKMKPEERAVFQGLIDDFYNRFVTVVDDGRPALTREQVLKLADGRIYSAEQARQHGLVDRIGTLSDAISIAKERAGIRAAVVVAYRRPLGWTPTIYAACPNGAAPAAVNLININLPELWTKRPVFGYIWCVSE